MSAANLLLDLGRLGIQLEAHGDRLRYYPRSALTPDLVDQLKAHKAELLAALRPVVASSTCWRCGSAAELIEGASGLWCGDCEQLVWRIVEDSIIRGDQEPIRFEELPKVVECPNCGDIRRRWDVTGVLHCVTCEPGRS